MRLCQCRLLSRSALECQGAGTCFGGGLCSCGGSFPCMPGIAAAGCVAFTFWPWPASHICQQICDAAGDHIRCRYANTNVPHHAIPSFSSNDTHHRYVQLLLPLHHLLSDSSDSDAMAAGYLACGGRIAGLSWVLLLCQKLASMEARLQRPRLDDDDTSQICTLLGQMEQFLGDLLFTIAAAARLVRDTNSWVVTYRVSYDA